jgi:alpha-1,2-mannosyltransferase
MDSLYSVIAVIPVTVAFIFSFTRFRLSGRKSSSKIVAFFHPYAAGRGGGERVLWAAIDGLIGRKDVERIIIYSIDVDKKEILQGRNKAFNFKENLGDSKIQFKKLSFVGLLDPSTWPIATVFAQSLGSVIVLLSALFTSPVSDWPDVFIDTTGFPFTLPMAKIITGAKTHAYIHYPTMSNDMFRKVCMKKTDFNNSALYTKFFLLYSLKLLYYRLFLLCYRICGMFVDVAVGNSTWTVYRIQEVWHRDDVAVLYPPAAIGLSKSIKTISSKEDKARENILLSLAQFRPEKNHALQIRVFKRVLEKSPQTKFWIMGGCRNTQDEELLSGLKKLAIAELRIPRKNIEFVVNASWEEISQRLRRGKCAIHTMMDEHFGISLLEFLDAKIPIVCHRSGGPESDILLPDEQFGYLATKEEEFAEKIENVLKNFNSGPVHDKRVNGYNSLYRFYSDERFGKEFARIFL